MATVLPTEFFNGRARIRVSLAAGETSDWFFYHAAAATAKPGAGGTMRAEVTMSPPSVIDAGNAVIVPWDAGDTSTVNTQQFDAATAVRFVCAGAAGVGEVSEV